MNTIHTAVIGSGPAGLTAAMYLARADLHPTLFAGSIFGGQLMITTQIENFPGFPEGIQGPELMDRMIQQVKNLGAEILYDDVLQVNFSQKPFSLSTHTGTRSFDAVVIATGATSKKLGLKSEIALTGRGVSYCATCDGAFFRNKEIAVIGGGDSAMEEATFLTRFARKVYLIHRRETFKASKIMQNRALENEKIVPLYSTEVLEILGDERLEGVKLFNNSSKEESTLTLDGLFVAIGHTPNTGIFTGHIDLDEQGYIKRTKETATNIPGIFSAGDVDDLRYRQAITAAGEGCRAALDVEKYFAAIE